MTRAPLLCCIAILTGGCRLEMHDQPKRSEYTESKFFEDRSAQRPLPQGVVARGFLRTNTIFFEGLQGTNLVAQIPLQLSKATLERGRQRFDIYCAVCHGPAGEGDGMVVQRGFPRPPSFNEDRLRTAPDGHLFRVITYGYGVMFPYANRVKPEDRWAIVAYIRALQHRNAVEVSNLPPEARQRLIESAR